jgi:hypothetical protein
MDELHENFEAIQTAIQHYKDGLMTRREMFRMIETIMGRVDWAALELDDD